MVDEAVAETRQKLAGHLTLALTVAARVAEVAMHRRAQQMRDAEQRSKEAARATLAQQRAEVAVTKQQLRSVGQPEWWERSTPAQVATAYTTARAYGRIDPQLAATADQMAAEIRQRYGVDAEQLARDTVNTEAWAAAAATDVGVDTQAQAAALAEETRRQAEAEIEAEIHRFETVLDRLSPEMQAEFSPERVAELVAQERQAAQLLVAEADLTDATAREVDAMVVPGVSRDDSLEPMVPVAVREQVAMRHEGLAARLDEAGVPADAKEARLIADSLHDVPVAQAAGGKSTAQAVKPRTTQARSQQRTRHM